MKERLTFERLHDVLDYDQATGIFTWKDARHNGAAVGRVAGCKTGNGYMHIRVDGKLYKSHRLAWCYVHGYFPENQIDHINRVKDDNRFINLREISRQCNSRNCNISKNNLSGVNGVCWRREKWYVQIGIDKEQKYIGSYDDFDEAVCARLAAEQCSNWEGCDSSSSAYQYVKSFIRNK